MSNYACNATNIHSLLHTHTLLVSERPARTATPTHARATAHMPTFYASHKPIYLFQLFKLKANKPRSKSFLSEIRSILRNINGQGLDLLIVKGYGVAEESPRRTLF